jgi:hypothetical protein
MLGNIVRAATPAVAVIAILATTSSASVLVVDASGGGGYTQIQAAVDAAVDGDTILVKSGSYRSFRVGDRELAIVGDTGRDVRVVGSIILAAFRVEPVSTAMVACLRSMTARYKAGPDRPWIRTRSQKAGAAADMVAGRSRARCSLRAPSLWLGTEAKAVRGTSCPTLMAVTVATASG